MQRKRLVSFLAKVIVALGAQSMELALATNSLALPTRSGR
jgi:hypothetical protein